MKACKACDCSGSGAMLFQENLEVYMHLLLDDCYWWVLRLPLPIFQDIHFQLFLYFIVKLASYPGSSPENLGGAWVFFKGMMLSQGCKGDEFQR